MASYDELTIGDDIAVNGRSLSSLIAIHGKLCVLAHLRFAGRAALVKSLLLRAPAALPSGRCPLYVCDRCGDLGCGTVAVRVTEVDDCFVWSDFAYDAPEGGSPIDWFDDRDERVFYFARADYLAAIY